MSPVEVPRPGKHPASQIALIQLAGLVGAKSGEALGKEKTEGNGEGEWH